MVAIPTNRRHNDNASSSISLRVHLCVPLIAVVMFVAGCKPEDKTGKSKTDGDSGGKPNPAKTAGNKTKPTAPKPKKETETVKAVDLARMYGEDKTATEKKFSDGPIRIEGRVAQLDLTRGGFYLYGTSETIIRCIISRRERVKIGGLHFGQTVIVEGSPSFVSDRKGMLDVRSCRLVESKPYTTPEQPPADVSVFGKAHIAVFKNKTGKEASDALAALAKWDQPRAGRPILFEGEVRSWDFLKATEARFTPIEAIVFNKSLDITVRCHIVSSDFGESLAEGDMIRILGSQLTIQDIKDKRQLVLRGCLKY